MKHNATLTVLCCALIMLVASCDKYEGAVTTPSYLTINSISVADTPSESWSNEDGFFTSRIESVNVVIYVQGDTAETNLGIHQLPCRIPVLRNGNIDRITISPIVLQDGIAGKRIYYSYYTNVDFTNVRLTADSVTDLGDIVTHYKSHSLVNVLWQEYFEPGPSHISLDSVVQRCTAPDTVRSGYGCGVIRVAPSQSVVNFWATSLDTITDETKTLYLEMDYWSDLDFSVGLKNPISYGDADQTYSHMTIFGKPQQGWRKIYINIGQLWSKTYNHYPYIRLYFSALNESGKGGNIYLDNMKLITI